MEIYKLGNKIKCIIRSVSSDDIGDTVITYANQPYTILTDVTANVVFRDNESISRHHGSTIFYHDMSSISSITLSNVLLTDKIMNLIFPKSQTKLAHVAENYETNDNAEVFLNYSGSVYQVFVYNDEGELEVSSCQGSWDTSLPLKLKHKNRNYLIAYSYERELAYDLNNFKHSYVTLDLEIQGNTNDTSSTMWLHLDKCGVQVDKNLYFSQHSNAIDLVFHVISDRSTENYITVK